MKNCSSCHTKLLDSAKFCHRCGTKASTQRLCPDCNYANYVSSKECDNCGYSWEADENGLELYIPRFKLDFRNTIGLSVEIKAHFLNALRDRLEEEGGIDRYNEYVDLVYKSNFKEILEKASNEMAEEVYTIHSRNGMTSHRQIDSILEDEFDQLLDIYLIKFCTSLNEINLPNAILKYQNISLSNLVIQEMIVDYLDLVGAEEKYYIDFLKMPLNKLKNAGTTFLFPAKDERIVLISDQTVFGSCKEGFAFTDSALYWKAHFETARSVHYRELEEIKRSQEWISINGLFFNVNPVLNTRMLRLLKKLKQLYRYPGL